VPQGGHNHFQASPIRFFLESGSNVFIGLSKYDDKDSVRIVSARKDN
jgi:hypothetical protein